MVALTLASPAQTRKLARVLALQLRPPMLLTVEGDLGTGKTTLVREVLRARGVRGAITSPSFTLAQSYHGREGEQLHHLDLYRLSRGADAELFAWDDYLGSGRGDVRRVAGGRQRRAPGAGRARRAGASHAPQPFRAAHRVRRPWKRRSPPAPPRRASRVTRRRAGAGEAAG